MSPPKVYAPNVHLFAYHLRKIGQAQTGNSTDNLNELFANAQVILNKFGIDQLILVQDKPGYKVELLGQQTEDNASILFEKWSASPITGLAYPVRIHDTYALALNIRRPEKDEQGKKTPEVDLDYFKRLHPNQCWMPDQVNSSLSQTLLLTVWYNSEKTWQFWQRGEHQKDLKKIADQCLEAFIPDALSPPPFYQAGELFNSPIFEYGTPELIENNCHVLVWIFCTPKTDDLLQEHYANLLELYCYRNKIIKAYQLSRDLYKTLVNDYQAFEKELKLFEMLPVNQSLDSASLESLKSQLKHLPRLDFDYNKSLQDLEMYGLIIEINAKNYERELQNIQKQSPDNNLSFLADFFNQYHIFQEQIKADLAYLKQGSALVDKTINAIRGIVEIEQAQIDRKLQNTIQAVGAGIGAGVGTAGILATSYPLIERDWKLPSSQNPTLIPHPFIMSLFLSFIFGGAIGGIIWWLVKQNLNKKL